MSPESKSGKWSFLPQPAREWLESLRERTLLEYIPFKKPQLDLEKLRQAYQQGPRSFQTFKHKYLTRLVAHRLARKVGPPLKVRAQCLLQDNREHPPLGDPNTWILDPTDPDSLTNVGSFLLENLGRRELWMGFAMQDDFVDPAGDKTLTPPLIKGINTLEQLNQIVQLLHGKLKLSQIETALFQANRRPDGTNRLEEIDNLLFTSRTNKLAKLLAQIENPNFPTLLTPDKHTLLNKVRPQAKEMINRLDNLQNWAQLNRWLRQCGQHPLLKENHFLVKLFPQDNPRWQIGDLIVDQNSVVIEIAPNQFSARSEGSLSSAPISIKILREHGHLFVFASNSDPVWLQPFLHSSDFLTILDKYLIPHLGPSSYHQLQFMLELGEDNSSAKKIANAHLAFITDIISGLHPNNPHQDSPAILPLAEIFDSISSSQHPLTVLEPKLETYVLNYYQRIMIFASAVKTNSTSLLSLQQEAEILLSLSPFFSSPPLPPVLRRIMQQIAAKHPPNLTYLDTDLIYLRNKLNTAMRVDS